MITITKSQKNSLIIWSSKRRQKYQNCFKLNWFNLTKIRSNLRRRPKSYLNIIPTKKIFVLEVKQNCNNKQAPLSSVCRKKHHGKLLWHFWSVTFHLDLKHWKNSLPTRKTKSRFKMRKSKKKHRQRILIIYKCSVSFPVEKKQCDFKSLNASSYCNKKMNKVKKRMIGWKHNSHSFSFFSFLQFTIQLQKHFWSW